MGLYLPRQPAYNPAAAVPLPRIVIDGAPLRNVALCGACHGALDNKLGIPRLEGQSAVYLKSQLEAFASTTGVTTSVSRCATSHGG